MIILYSWHVEEGGEGKEDHLLIEEEGRGYQEKD